MTPISSQNRHIEKYLDYYCGLEHSPEYAVLLNGVWGSGKTWFAKKYCEKLKENNEKYLYVSLYGITSFAEIEDAFFEQLHKVEQRKRKGKLSGDRLKHIIKDDLTPNIEKLEKMKASQKTKEEA